MRFLAAFLIALLCMTGDSYAMGLWNAKYNNCVVKEIDKCRAKGLSGTGETTPTPCTNQAFVTCGK